jgi:hypothetical protein
MKRKIRMAWGLSGLLAVALTGGLTVTLQKGVTVGDVQVRVRPTHRWTTVTVCILDCGLGNNFASTSVRNLGFVAVDTTRIYHSRSDEGPAARFATPSVARRTAK